MGHTILAKFRLINSSKQFHSLSNLEKEIKINQNDLNWQRALPITTCIYKTAHICSMVAGTVRLPPKAVAL